MYRTKQPSNIPYPCTSFRCFGVQRWVYGHQPSTFLCLAAKEIIHNKFKRKNRMNMCALKSKWCWRAVFSRSFMSNDSAVSPTTLSIFLMVAKVVPSPCSQKNQTTSFSKFFPVGEGWIFAKIQFFLTEFEVHTD